MSDPQQQHRAAILAATVTAVTALIVAKAAEAQVALLGGFAKLIARYGVGDLLLFSMRKQAGSVAASWQASVPELARQVVDKAATDGGGSGGGTHTPKFGVAGDSYESHAERSARAIREDLAGKLNQIGYRLTRYADDVYRTVLADAAQAQVFGLTPAQAQHEAYRRLVRQGVTGFVDTKGRNWELSAYVEMATRTAAERAFNVSHLDRMQSLGFDLFTIPDDGHPCPLCLPWQGKVLSVLPDGRADATLAEATAAGLFHPRCRHVLVGFIPGVTVIPEPHAWTAEDAARYAESQYQRRLEREIRAAKRELAAAFTPELRSRAQFGLRRAQARMREFIARSGRVRNTRREQLNLGANA